MFIFICFLIINAMRFIVDSKELTRQDVSGIIIDEVCVTDQILELERYLEIFDQPEAQISDTPAYLGFDYCAEVAKPAVKDIELSPFGQFTADWKRLRILYDRLTRPDDEDIKSKFVIIYKILIDAYKRICKSSEEGESSTIVEENRENQETEILGAPVSQEEREKRSTDDLDRGSTDSPNKIYEEEDLISSSDATLNFEGFSEPPEVLDFGDEDSTGIGEKSKTELATVIVPQIEEVEPVFRDSEAFEEVTEPEIQEFKTADRTRSKEAEDEKPIEVEDYEGRVTGFENPKSSEHVASETINAIVSPGTEKAVVTTAEIKPDVRNEDLETGISTLSPSVLQIDRETRRYLSPEYSSTRYFITPSLRDDKKKKIFQYFDKGMKNSKANSAGEGRDAATRKTLVLNVAESFSNAPRPVQVIKKKEQNFGNHISRVRDFEEEKYSRIGSPLAGFNPGNRRETAGKFPGNKHSGFSYFRRDRLAAGRHGKRGGDNTDVGKLYRWFYRAGEKPEKSAPEYVANF